MAVGNMVAKLAEALHLQDADDSADVLRPVAKLLGSNQVILIAIVDSSGAIIDPSASVVEATLGDGRKVVTTAGVREPLVAVSTPVEWVTIQALRGNTGDVTVGAVTVVAAGGTERGITLPNYSTRTYGKVDLNDIYVDAVNDGDGVSFDYGA